MRKNLKKLAHQIANDTELTTFFKEFVTQLPDLKTQSQYTSDKGTYSIEYLDYIPDDMGGMHATPVRIHTSGYIQVGKSQIYRQSNSLRTSLFFLYVCIAQNKIDAEYAQDYVDADAIAFNVMKQINLPLSIEDMDTLLNLFNDPSKPRKIYHAEARSNNLYSLSNPTIFLDRFLSDIPLYRRIRRGDWYKNRYRFNGGASMVMIWDRYPAGNETFATEIYSNK